MRLTPIVAVVDEHTLDALRDHAATQPDAPAGLQAVMDRNGWTIDAMCAGAIIKAALDYGVERVT